MRVIARELPARHPDLFFRITRERWDSALAATEARLPTLTRDEALVALMELVALVGDGHTAINPLFATDTAIGLRYYPFELYRFDDGLFIRSAAPAYANLAGARVIRIGRASAADALAAAARVVSHENDWWVRAWAPMWLGIPEIVDGLGLTNDPARLPLVVERHGKRDTVVVRPMGRLRPSGHRPGGAIDRTGWIQMRQAGEPPLWRRNPDRPYWMEYRTADSTLYVCYRGVISLDPPNDNPAFWHRVFATADSLPVRRFVIDIRENMGGNGFYNRQVIRGLVARPQLDRPDRTFVIIGRQTFSAAMALARDLEHWTNATFVGEPTGNALTFFGDHEPVRLPASGLIVNVSTLRWPPYDPRDHRDFLAPAVYTPLTSAEYRANVDPAMRAILRRGRTPPLADRVRAAVLAGDTTGARRLIEAARADIANRFRSPEGDVNRLGYELLHEHRVAAAVTVFHLNARAFPGSANVWDSLGEALLAAGRRAEAIAAYRHAIEIAPGFPPSRQALERLGIPVPPP